VLFNHGLVGVGAVGQKLIVVVLGWEELGVIGQHESMIIIIMTDENEVNGVLYSEYGKYRTKHKMLDLAKME
jgi:hypothetical protein